MLKKNTSINRKSPKEKRRRIFFILFIVFTSLWVFTGSRDKDVKEPKLKNKRHGTAIIITGAAAKIAQEAALLEHLYNKGMLKDVVFISGASSGGLNAAVLNGILSGKMTWKEYKNVLSGLKNEDIFITNGAKFPVDTDPLRTLITKIVTDMGYRTLYDLPYPTAFSIVNLKVLPLKDRTFRLSNRRINSESDSSLSIVDVLMASSAYPIAFPPVLIRNVKTIPNVPYYDGGIASDHVPYQALLEFEKYRGVDVEKMIIISRKRDTIPNLRDEFQQFGVNKFKLLEKMGVSPEAISNRGFYKRLKDIQKDEPDLAERTYVYLPDFKEDFLMFDFNNLKKQYDLTTQWAQTHEPVLLKNYLEKRL